MNKLDLNDLLKVIAFIFVMFLAWNILVSNHTKDVKRDEFYATHCKQVKQTEVFSKIYNCQETK
jgi:1,4-dihydroxy-2-naphthoate octaprenyltransferase